MRPHPRAQRAVDTDGLGCSCCLYCINSFFPLAVLKTLLVLVGADPAERGVAATRVVERLDVAGDREPRLVAALVAVPLDPLDLQRRDHGLASGVVVGIAA